MRAPFHPLPAAAVLLLLSEVLGHSGMAYAAAPEPTLSAALQGQKPVGTARLRYWGFDVYDASLYAAPGFEIQRFENQRFGLELSYLRKLKGADIAERSIDEMKGLATIDPAQAQRWLAAMSALFPDVQSGDRITGVHAPGIGARFYLNGTLLGEVADDAFSRLFFGIWLSPKTSQPRMRQALIQSMVGSAPRAP
ncbi:chalcone isomerase family protein [Hydrogenophaga sp.]|uniref:chalcone isomerase family protein n=1 Tax=Hydrogenophaga sp. TaxID=1904254 RepID=UPI00271DB0E5|nr:chalcone isomerase family protein [Hydrogenophaga sp.]MDO9439216.1 chalcone isomerase family protein [Hydrogenophaga sp.]